MHGLPTLLISCAYCSLLHSLYVVNVLSQHRAKEHTHLASSSATHVNRPIRSSCSLADFAVLLLGVSFRLGGLCGWYPVRSSLLVDRRSQPYVQPTLLTSSANFAASFFASQKPFPRYTQCVEKRCLSPVDGGAFQSSLDSPTRNNCLEGAAGV
jgi:hypothetical protein